MPSEIPKQIDQSLVAIDHHLGQYQDSIENLEHPQMSRIVDDLVQRKFPGMGENGAETAEDTRERTDYRARIQGNIHRSISLLQQKMYDVGAIEDQAGLATLAEDVDYGFISTEDAEKNIQALPQRYRAESVSIPPQFEKTAQGVLRLIREGKVTIDDIQSEQLREYLSSTTVEAELAPPALKVNPFLFQLEYGDQKYVLAPHEIMMVRVCEYFSWVKEPVDYDQIVAYCQVLNGETLPLGQDSKLIVKRIVSQMNEKAGRPLVTLDQNDLVTSHGEVQWDKKNSRPSVELGTTLALLYFIDHIDEEVLFEDLVPLVGFKRSSAERREQKKSPYSHKHFLFEAIQHLPSLCNAQPRGVRRSALEGKLHKKLVQLSLAKGKDVDIHTYVKKKLRSIPETAKKRKNRRIAEEDFPLSEQLQPEVMETGDNEIVPEIEEGVMKTEVSEPALIEELSFEQMTLGAMLVIGKRYQSHIEYDLFPSWIEMPVEFTDTHYIQAEECIRDPRNLYTLCELLELTNEQIHSLIESFYPIHDRLNAGEPLIQPLLEEDVPEEDMPESVKLSFEQEVDEIMDQLRILAAGHKVWSTLETFSADQVTKFTGDFGKMLKSQDLQRFEFEYNMTDLMYKTSDGQHPVYTMDQIASMLVARRRMRTGGMKRTDLKKLLSYFKVG
jgi:hypothetical protein